MGWPELLEHVRRRRGVVTLADARAHDVSRSVVYRRARQEAWTKLHPGVWLVAGAPDTDDARLVAAIAATDGVARGQSALWLHGVLPRAPHPPQILVDHARNGSLRRGALDVRRTTTLTDDDVTSVRGFPATTAAFAIVDVAPGRGVRGTRRLVIDAERDGRLQREELVALLGRLGRGVPGVGVVRAVLEDLGGLRSDSDTEHDLRRDLIELGYPVHPEPFPYRCDDGVVVHLDLALPEHWVYLEVDGFGTHRKRRVFEADRVKWTQIVRHWRPVWVTARRWRNERDRVLRDLDDAIADADPARPPAPPAP